MREDFLLAQLKERKELNAYRELKLIDEKIDFCSNDYLGIVKNKLNSIQKEVLKAGSTGSRLLAGNYSLVEEVEKEIAQFHDAEAALIFNSGYDANTGLLSSLPQRGDTIIYDSLSHASIRDGIRLSFGKSYSFQHNDVKDLEKKIKSISKEKWNNVFVVTESVFSMDGDIAPLQEIAALCKQYEAHLIVDEAHATGVLGDRGEGVVQMLGLQKDCLARIYTFGKALGAFGAAVLGSENLRNFLINFSRSFIYTTALPEINIAAIRASYQLFPTMQQEREQLKKHIYKFQNANIPYQLLYNETPIQVIIVPGNEEVKELAKHLQNNNFDVRPILYPTVPVGGERLRIVLHAFNTESELEELIQKITYF